MPSKYDFDNDYGDDFCLSGRRGGGGGGGSRGILNTRKKTQSKQKTHPDGRYNSKHIRISEAKKNYEKFNEKKSDLVEEKKTRKKGKHN